MPTKKKAPRKARPIDLRRVVVYDLSDDEKARAGELAEADERSLSQWVARLVRAELDRHAR